MRFIYFYCAIATRDLLGKHDKIRIKQRNFMNKSSFFIVGQHAVIEALKNPNRKVLRVFLTEDSKKILNKENQNQNLLKGIPLFYKNKKELDRLCSKEQMTHQGLIAEIEHLAEINLKNYLNNFIMNN